MPFSFLIVETHHMVIVLLLLISQDKKKYSYVAEFSFVIIQTLFPKKTEAGY